MGRRILLTGLDTFWGGKVAAALEADPAVEVIVGMGTGTPSVELERTEFVRADNSYSLFSRVVRATRVDTIVHTFLVLDSSAMSGRALHETNVIGTMNLLAAAGAPGSSIRQIVVKSSSLVYGSHPSDPAWFSEGTPRSRTARNRVERSLCEVEGYVSDFAEDNPGVGVTVLRFANVLGADIDTPISRNLARGVMPCVAGFDPLVQFVEEDDVVRCVEFAVKTAPRGIFNVAGDGKLPVTEVASIAAARRLPLPPVLTAQAAAPLVRLGLLSLPTELQDLLRYGRGIDTTRLAEAGFRPQFSSAGAVQRFAEANRVRRSLGDQLPRYRYEPDVEAFFRRSPAVVRDAGAPLG
ncbi:MAG TPA: NAD-dependent epimerase/dehydratase family protein [Acidimicrobiales bacterium]|nr:NAD-dependent epimerase/dehydratase family protein [Acidimicrobiales bacterium]